MTLHLLILALVACGFWFAWVYAGELDEREEGEWAFVHGSLLSRAQDPATGQTAGRGHARQENPSAFLRSAEFPPSRSVPPSRAPAPPTAEGTTELAAIGSCVSSAAPL